MKKYTTKKEAEKYFKEFIYPNCKNDKGAARFAWAVYIDELCKSGKITSYKYSNWMPPRCIR